MAKTPLLLSIGSGHIPERKIRSVAYTVVGKSIGGRDTDQSE